MTSSLCLQLLGPSALTAVTVFLSLLPLNFFITKKRNHYQVWSLTGKWEEGLQGSGGGGAAWHCQPWSEPFSHSDPCPHGPHLGGWQLCPSSIQATNNSGLVLTPLFHSHPRSQLLWLKLHPECSSSIPRLSNPTVSHLGHCRDPPGGVPTSSLTPT